MESALHKDRRIFERVDVKFPVDIKYHEGKKDIKCQCSNIGASGIGVICNAKLPQDKDVKVTMYIPDSHEPQSMYAKVAWTKDGTVGLEFSGLNLDSVDLFKFWRIFRLPGVRKPVF
jgi:hypothetical protein